MQEFLKNVDFKINNDAYVFAVATYGGTSGNTYPMVNKALADKGVTLNAVFGVNMRPTYVVLYDMPKIVYLLSRNAPKKIDKIADRILAKSRLS